MSNTYHDNAQHIDHSKTLHIHTDSANLSDLVNQFFNDVAPTKNKEDVRKEHLVKKSTPRKCTSLPQPYTIKYNCKNREMRNRRLQLLLQKWVEWKWIEDVMTFDDFDSFFAGDIRECNLKWIGTNEATLYALLKEILKQPFVDKQEKCSARSIGIGQFHIANFRANASRVTNDDNLRITISVLLLNPQKPLPSLEISREDESYISDRALSELYADDLHITKNI